MLFFFGNNIEVDQRLQKKSILVLTKKVNIFHSFNVDVADLLEIEEQSTGCKFSSIS